MNLSATLPQRRRVRRFAARLDDLVERANPALVLGAIVGGAALMWGFYALQVTDAFVHTDELQTVRLAMTIAEELSLSPQIRGAAVDANNQLYPLVLAPLYGAFDTPTAFKLAHALNAVLMASTAVPAYLLARELHTPRMAGYCVAALSVAVPWVAFVDMLRAETLAYPAFTWAVLAMLRAVVQPGPRGDVIALGAIAVAFFVRTQFVSLGISFVLVVLLYTVLQPLMDPTVGDRRRKLLGSLKRAGRAHSVLVVVGGVVLAAAAVRGLDGVLGSYAGTAAQGDLLPPGLAPNVGKHLAILAAAVGVVPFALGFAWALGSLVRPASREAQAFALLALVTGAIVCVQASSFVIRFAGPAAFDRYFFYLVPLALVGMVACISEGRRFWLLAAATAPVVVWLVRFEPFVPTPGPFHASPPAAFYTVLEFHGGRLGLSVAEVIRWGGFVCVLAASLLLRFVAPRVVLVVISGVLLIYGVGQSRSVFRSLEGTQMDSPFGHPANPDWIDDLVPAGTPVALMPSLVTIPPAENPVDTFASSRLWWDYEFWNKRVADAYVVHTDPASDVTPFSKHWAVPELHRGRLEIQGLPAAAQARFLAIDPKRADLRLAGRPIGSSPDGEVDLLRVTPPYRLRYVTSGLVKGVWMTPGMPAVLTSWGRTARSVKLTLNAPPETPKRLRFSLRSDGETLEGSVPPTGRGSASVRVCVPAGRAQLQLRAQGGTQVLAVGFVGVRIAAVELTPRPGGC